MRLAAIIFFLMAPTCQITGQEKEIYKMRSFKTETRTKDDNGKWSKWVVDQKQKNTLVVLDMTSGILSVYSNPEHHYSVISENIKKTDSTVIKDWEMVDENNIKCTGSFYIHFGKEELIIVIAYENYWVAYNLKPAQFYKLND